MEMYSPPVDVNATKTNEDNDAQEAKATESVSDEEDDEQVFDELKVHSVQFKQISDVFIKYLLCV